MIILSNWWSKVPDNKCNIIKNGRNKLTISDKNAYYQIFLIIVWKISSWTHFNSNISMSDVLSNCVIWFCWKQHSIDIFSRQTYALYSSKAVIGTLEMGKTKLRIEVIMIMRNRQFWCKKNTYPSIPALSQFHAI